MWATDAEPSFLAASERPSGRTKPTVERCLLIQPEPYREPDKTVA